MRADKSIGRRRGRILTRSEARAPGAGRAAGHARGAFAWCRAGLCLIALGWCLVAAAAWAAGLDRSASVLAPGREQWADFVETNFPFFSSTLDARKLGVGWPADNLTPRGLILNLGHDSWACFDIDLLRLAAIWTGQGVSPVSMSQISYHSAGTKAKDGQGDLTKPAGTPWQIG